MRKISFFFERSEKSCSSRYARTINILIAVAITSLTLTACSKNQIATTTPTPTPSAKDIALKNAINIYARAKEKGLDFSSGPCLGQIAPDWVADIAHNPRIATDNDPKNQCADFIAGRAHHFIELDPSGNLIRII